MILSILIATIPDRKDMFNQLLLKFVGMGYRDEVEILSDNTGKQISIGRKRNNLLKKATGDWIVFFDDDDWPCDDYIGLILNAIKSNPGIDCLGIRGLMTTNGLNPKTWCHRLGYPIEGNGKVPTEYSYDYVRPIIHFNPVLRSRALRAGFTDMRFGEDMDYAKRLNKQLRKEYFIDQELFHYRYTNTIPHKKKYGYQ